MDRFYIAIIFGVKRKPVVRFSQLSVRKDKRKRGGTQGCRVSSVYLGRVSSVAQSRTSALMENYLFLFFAGRGGELVPGPGIRRSGDRSRLPREPGFAVRLAADAPVRDDAENRVQGESAGMLGVQDLPGLSGCQGSVLRLVLVGEQMQSAQRLPGRRQRSPVLDLVQERQMHDHHDRHT